VEPPLLVGGVNETVACALPATAETFVGGLGTLSAVTTFAGESSNIRL